MPDPRHLRVIDFETTGMPPDAALCEVAWVDVDAADRAIDDFGALLVDPGRPIPPEAMAVHHITDAECAGGVSPAEACARLVQDPPHAFVAHNAAFERHFFDGGEVPWIDTWKVALRLWPDAPSHANQVLRYWLKLELNPERATPPHRALPDAYVTAHILLAALDAGTGVADMIAWTAEPAVLPRLPFGKHRGKRWSEPPPDYLEWLTRQQDMDADVRHGARTELARRRGDGSRR